MARMISSLPASIAVLALAGVATCAQAQIVDVPTDAPATPLLVPGDTAEPQAGDAATAETDRNRPTRRGAGRPRVDITPYLEVGAVLTGEFTNGGDLLTWSTAAAGVEGVISTRRAQAAASIRYERRFSLSDNLPDADLLSGVLRGRYELAPGLSLEAGGIADYGTTDSRFSPAGLVTGTLDNVSQVYSLYAGPTFGRRIGDVDVGAAYRFGYTRSEVEQRAVLPTGAVRIGSFDDATNHALIASVGMGPRVAPVGWRLSGGLEQEDAGQLDQRYRGYHARLDLIRPVAPTLALVGSVGYEHIRVSARSPLRDAAGVPVLDRDGRLVSDRTQPRQIAFDTDGLIWDAGVMWRPSRRLSVEARIGRRYGDTIFTGGWSWRAGADTVVAMSAYDNFTTAGRQLTSALATLPTDFDLFRNPVGGGIAPCVFGADGANCIGNDLDNLSGFGFRNRGLTLSASTRLSRWSVSAAMGYDRRRYVANVAAGLGSIDGTTDDNWFAMVAASRSLDQQTSLSTGIYLNYFDSGFAGAADGLVYGANATLSHNFIERLSGSLGLGVSAIDQDGFNRRAFGTAIAGLRYSF